MSKQQLHPTASAKPQWQVCSRKSSSSGATPMRNLHAQEGVLRIVDLLSWASLRQLSTLLLLVVLLPASRGVLSCFIIYIYIYNNNNNNTNTKTNVHINTSVCVYVCMYVCIYIYIYMYREREGWASRSRDQNNDTTTTTNNNNNKRELSQALHRSDTNFPLRALSRTGSQT